MIVMRMGKYASVQYCGAKHAGSVNTIDTNDVSNSLEKFCNEGHGRPSCDRT
jgi:hypothetical protein